MCVHIYIYLGMFNNRQQKRVLLIGHNSQRLKIKNNIETKNNIGTLLTY